MLAHANEDRLRRPARAALAGRLFAAALIWVFGLAEFAASWHDAKVRHVRCAEHGEAIDVAVVSDLEALSGSERGTDSGIESAEGAEAAAHDHCPIVVAFRGSARARLLRLATRLAPPPVVVPRASEPAPRPGRAFVLACAPKTSPPSV